MNVEVSGRVRGWSARSGIEEYAANLLPATSKDMQESERQTQRERRCVQNADIIRLYRSCIVLGGRDAGDSLGKLRERRR